VEILDRIIKRFSYYSLRRQAKKASRKLAGKWVFIDLDNQSDRDLLGIVGNGKTLFECEITFQLTTADERETTGSWLNALKADELKSPTIEFDKSARAVSIRFAETVTRPGGWFFSAERLVSEAISSHAGINISESTFIKQGRLRVKNRRRFLFWR
jgi:hypothetical protein